MRNSKTFMVEFLGTPEAGKSTTITSVAKMLESAGKKVLVLEESAESLPTEIPKGTFEANLWMHFITQAGIIKAKNTNVDIVLIDREIIDSKFYAWKYLKEGKCTLEQYNEFQATCLKGICPDLLLGFFALPEVAIKRRGGEGKLVNRTYLEKYNQFFMEFFNDVKIRKELIKTDEMTILQVSNLIYSVILNAIP